MGLVLTINKINWMPLKIYFWNKIKILVMKILIIKSRFLVEDL